MHAITSGACLHQQAVVLMPRAWWVAQAAAVWNTLQILMQKPPEFAVQAGAACSCWRGATT